MPRTVAQNQEIREASRTKLLDSALKTFAEHGYANTSVRKIASEAGVSLGLLYRYFGGKEELLQSVFDRSMALLSNRFDHALARCDGRETAPKLVTTIFDTLMTEQQYWSLFYNLRAQPGVTTILGDSFRLWTKRLRDIFQAYFEEHGRSEAELDAYVLYSLVEGTIQQYLLEPETYPLEGVVKHILAYIDRS